MEQMVFSGEDIAFLTRVYNETIAVVTADPTIDIEAPHVINTVTMAIIHAVEGFDVAGRQPDHVFDTAIAAARIVAFRIVLGFPLRPIPHEEPGVTPPESTDDDLETHMELGMMPSRVPRSPRDVESDVKSDAESDVETMM